MPLGARARSPSSGARRTRCRWRSPATAAPRSPALGEVLVVEARGGELVDGAARPRACSTHGLAPARPACRRGDTQIAAYLIDPGRARLLVDDLAEETGVELTVQSDEETAALVRAAAAIAAAARRMPPELEERELTAAYHDIELPLVPVLADMEAAGVKLDTYRLAEIAAKLRDQVDELEARAYELAEGPFTLGSPKQLGEVLFERLGLPVDRKGKTGYSTDARVLAKHPRPAPDRRRGRAVARAVEAAEHLPGAAARAGRPGRRPAAHLLQPDHRRHRPALVDPARTCRTSRCARRSGREIRGAFVAEPGFTLLSADYSQVELRILAHLSGEPVLHGRLRARRGHPPRDRRAGAGQAAPPSSPASERNRAKAVNFGIIYGISAFGLSEQLGISREEAQSFIDTYLARFPQVNEFIARDDRAGEGGRLRDHAVRPPPADPRAARVELPDPHAWASGWP